MANDPNDCAGDAPNCLDNPVIAVGPDKNNLKQDAIYVLYHSAVSKGLRVTHSLDGGATFSPSAVVGDGDAADVLVTKTGKLHVIYVGGSGNPMGDPANAVYYSNSADDGATFAPPVKVTAASDSVPLYFSSPHLLADLDRALLYAVYPVGSADGKWDIVLSTSNT